MIRRAKRDGREAREMRKERRKKIKEVSNEGIDKETKRQNEEKEGLRDPPLLEFLDPTLRCNHCFFKSSGITSWSSSINFFYQLIESIIKTNMSNRMQKNGSKRMQQIATECKIMCHW